MAISTSDRPDNMELALRLMLDHLTPGRPWRWELAEGNSAPFQAVLPTTWAALIRSGLVTGFSHNRYQFTPEGWIRALELA